MGKPVRYLCMLLLSVCLLAVQVPAARAAQAVVTFRGEEAGFAVSPGSEYSSTDLFPDLKDAMPGDTLTQTITLRHRAADAGMVRIYLRARPHGSGNPPAASRETAEEMKNFLSKLTLRVYRGQKLLYEDSPDRPSTLAENVWLATLDRYGKTTLRAELALPVTLDNRYADRVGEVDWVFTAEAFEGPKSPDSPKTGDMIGWAVAAMAVSGGALVLLRRKRR